MIFRQRTSRSGGGDNPLNHGVYYHYYRAGSFWDRFKPYRAEVILRNLTYESIGAWQDTKGRRIVLANNPWRHKGQHVWSWLEEMVQTGKVKMTVGHEFSVEGRLIEAKRGQLPDEEKPWIRVRFSDKGMAALFKLTFGGR